MQDQEKFLRLYNELLPLKKTIAGTIEYKKFRFSFEDILGLLDDKLIHVYLKYESTHQYEEIKALAISSLYNMRARIYRDYSHEISLEKEIEIEEEPINETPAMEKLFLTLGRILNQSQLNIAKLVLSPPAFVLARLNNFDSRIPSHLFLEFLEIPINKSTVKGLNKIRRDLRDLIRSRVDPLTLELRPK